MSKKILLLLPVFLGAVLFSGCSLLPQTETESDETMMLEENGENMEAEDKMMKDEESMEGEAMMEDDAMMGEEQEISMEMSNFKYSVSEITASPGETVEVMLKNVEGTHDFVIDELDVQSDMTQEGDETVVMFTIPEDAESGTEYAYYCSVGEHRAQGMEGVIMVK